MTTTKTEVSRFFILVLLFVSSFSYGTNVVWGSGKMFLPDGTTARTGDIQGWAWVQWRIPTTSEISGVLPDIASALYSTLCDDSAIRNLTIGNRVVRDNGNTAVYTAKSDSSGNISIEGGQFLSNGYANYTADVLYVCVFDGYEYYMGAHGIHYSTAAWPQLENENLALGGTWIRGEAIPEPTSGAFLLCGLTFLMLKRRRTNPVAHGSINPTLRFQCWIIF